MAHEIRLIKLVIRNFKGIREFVLDADGRSVRIFGDNGAGKTTVGDAASWLFTDKDSAGRKEFDITPLDRSGQPVHNLETEVSGLFDASGRPVALRKIYREVWTKKRGNSKAVLTGHTTDCYYDGVPLTQSEYKMRLGEIMPDNLRMLLTDPAYFSEGLKWPERRNILLEVCGNVTDAEVIASSQTLAELPKILAGRSEEDHRKVLNSQRKEINNRLEDIPKLIDENNRMLPAAGEDKATLQNEVANLRARRTVKTDALAEVDNGGGVIAQKQRLSKIDLDMLAIEQRVKRTEAQIAQQFRTQLNTVNGQIDAKQRELNRLRAELAEAEQIAKGLDARLDALNEQFDKADGEVYAGTVDEVCPACEQPLPTEKIEGARAAALAHFNRHKAEALERIDAEGRELAGKLDKAKAEQTRLPQEIAQADAALTQLNAQAADIRTKLNAPATDHTQDPEYRQFSGEKAQIEQTIAGLQVNSDPLRQELNGEIAAIDTQISEREGKIAQINLRETGLKRIADLEAEEKKLNVELERLDYELNLCDQFTEAQAALLEQRVNGHFKHARFKLFNPLMNGGKEPCCETLFNGVPYSTALNTGARINIGLDIINTLSQHYGLSLPIFVDNREAVTELVPTRAQVISLIVQAQTRCQHCSYIFPAGTSDHCPACDSVDVADYRGLRIEHDLAMAEEAS